MEVSNNFRKMQLLLQYMFEGKIVLKENLTERLLKLLEDTDENSPGKQLLNTPCISDLVYQAIGNINNVNTPAKLFLIQLITILFKNELHFNKMQLQDFKESFSKSSILQNLGNTATSSLYLACIKLLTAQATHPSGLKVIVNHKIWTKILHPDTHLKPINISKTTYNFMAILVSNLNKFNLESELIEVLGYVLKPILTSEYLNLTVIDAEIDRTLSEKLLTYLNALLAIITEANNFTNNTVATLMKEYFIVENILYDIYLATKIREMLKVLNACMFRIHYGVLQHLLISKQSDEFCMKMTIAHRNYVVCGVQKRDAFAIIDYTVQTNIIWSKIQKLLATYVNLPLTFQQNGQQVELSLQLAIHLVVPMLKYVALYRISNKLNMPDMVEEFYIKMGKTITDYIYSSCFVFGTLLDEGNVSYGRIVTIETLKELLRLRGHLNESQAGPIFQSLYYLLDIFVIYDETGRLIMNESTVDQEDLKLLSHLLDALKMLLKEHNISWYENVEVVILQADLLTLLKQNFLTTKHIVQILDLIDICVKKFLSPNMSLLVENNCKHSSTLNEIGEVIKFYVQHQEWEVRDSAFNILHTCTEISFIKYIPLQKVIKDNNLIIIAAKAGLTDENVYSQSTALRCLAAATKIDNIWHDVLVDNIHVYIQLVYLIRKHEEGIVRKECVNVLTGVYSNQKIEPNFLNTLYEVMTAAAIDDLHWEVQVAALNFWKRAINNYLTDRGMLDGKFPAVTFSKEKRKIIVLNKNEMKKQLTAVLNDLSLIGCLTVLVECVNDVHNTFVMSEAHSIANELIRILDIYKFEKVDAARDQIEAISGHLDQDMKIEMDLSYASSELDRNKIIDDILSVDQIELIMDLHDSFAQIKTDEKDIEYPCSPCRELIHPNKFLETFRSRDHSLLIENKSNIYTDNTRTLGALLDEILDLEATV